MFSSLQVLAQFCVRLLHHEVSTLPLQTGGVMLKPIVQALGQCLMLGSSSLQVRAN